MTPLNQVGDLPIVLDELLAATRRLQNALRDLDAQGIFQAVEDQTKALQSIERNAYKVASPQERKQLEHAVQMIVELNRCNQELSQYGLRSVRSRLRRMLTDSGYGPNGEARSEVDSGRVRASA